MALPDVGGLAARSEPLEGENPDRLELAGPYVILDGRVARRGDGAGSCATRLVTSTFSPEQAPISRPNSPAGPCTCSKLSSRSNDR
jgi:hypothetical protein